MQTQAYLENKEHIAGGKANETLIVMDFSQFQLEKGFCPDLVVVIHLYDPAAVDNLQRIYIHYIGEEGISNDVNFVAGKSPASTVVVFINLGLGVWQDLMQRDFFTNIDTIHIWTDGGPHHF